MPAIVTRKATNPDLELLVPLLDEYRRFYGMPPDADACRNFLAERFERNDSFIMLAFDEDKNTGAGFAQAYPVFSTVSLARQWLLNDLFIRPEYRRQKIAHRIMQSLHDHFHDQAKGLILVTARDNLPAREFYQREGWQSGNWEFFTWMYAAQGYRRED